MDLYEPILSVSPGVHGKVLAVLARTDTPLTGRTIASLVPNASLSGVQKVLKDLVLNGIVRLEPAGRAKLYLFDREHLAYPAVNALVHLRDELLVRITTEATGWDLPAVALWLFGSAARGEGGPGSDIDLLVVRPDDVADSDPVWLLQVDILSDHVARWTGNGCEVLEFSVTELHDLIRRGERLADELRRDAVSLFGTQPRQLLTRKSDR